MLKKLKKKIMVFIILLSLSAVYPAAAMAQVHTVSNGDTIYLISRHYGIDQYALRYTNGLWSDYLYVGQKLVIPSKYSVKKGDTLSAIAAKFGTDYKKIKEINKLYSADMIYPGQQLYIPVAGGSTTPAYLQLQRSESIQVSRGGRVSMADFDALARIITAEADSESFETQVAVGAVVLNRVDSPDFPNTIRGVIYQVDETGRYQFEPVLNGWINNPPSETAKRAAIEALNGSDPSNGALYFFESWVTNTFLKSRPVSKIMDSFTFTY
ncbi:LysM peptidoglycan-binding domain-containing protein [Desulfotruncus alcoholivorax]|uniref:LysM peptidoglycan-binding domain-containing protein n=1 Tax=Desulfotruncus alcoholivorax TaxID=265477 RepID=UPI0004071BC6|nr:LysM peptidoglycan-binding domain-containing protein [Desulfotruncus alcoholivorax]